MLRLLGGSLLIALLATAASATTFFEDVGIIADAIGHGVLIKPKGLAPTYAGKPVTILILGSDKRSESRDVYDRSDPAHSDTIILAHLDPQSGQTTLMSIPRDLNVSYTAHGQQYIDQKINSAFTYGQAPTTVSVVEHLLGIKINDVIVIDFQAFAYLVNGLGCVYVDVDHLYDNGDSAGDDYAHIYIPPGYRPLCYYQALSYVRYRHDDSTYARDAREQDFIRQAKQQLGIKTDLLTNPNDLQHLLDQVSSHGGLATNITGSNAILRLLEIAESSVSKPVRQLQFPDDGSVVAPNGGANQVAPSGAQLTALRASFLYGNAYNTASLPPPSQAPSSRHHHHAKSSNGGVAAGLVATPSSAYQDALVMQVHLPFPAEIPHLTSADGYFDGLDDFHPFKEVVPLLATDGGRVYHGYRITWEDGVALGAYYGIDGLDWTSPPLFENAKTDVIHGRTYKFVFNGKHYQDIGWIQGNDIYWVSNTIFDNLTKSQLLDMAESSHKL